MSNKVLLSITTIGLIVFFLASCSDEKNDTSIVLSENSIKLIAGARDTISIVSGNNEYFVTTDNNAVATATIEGKNIIIQTSEMGNAILTVNDQLNNTSEINVSAEGPKLGGWIEEFPVGVEFIYVESVNDEITEQIKSELWTEAEKRSRAMYNFGVSDFSYRSEDGSVTENGSYFVKDLILTLSYDDKNESYEIDGGLNRMILTRDLTAYYIEQYPNTEIIKVEEYRRLVYITY